MKNIAICYHGGCGGHFVYYYLLASEQFQLKVWNYKIKIKHLESQFYLQFQEKGDWLDNEIWPSNKINTDNKAQVFLVCDSIKEHKNFNFSNCIKICPYIENINDWFRTILYKKTNLFRKNKNIKSINFVKKTYKDICNFPPKLKIQNCNYYFDIIKFTHDYSERKKLCDFLQIETNDRMEQFVTHYQKLHTKLKKTDWVKKNNIDRQSKYIL